MSQADLTYSTSPQATHAGTDLSAPPVADPQAQAEARAILASGAPPAVDNHTDSVSGATAYSPSHPGSFPQSHPAETAGPAGLLVALAPLPPGGLATVLAHLAQAFPRASLLVASPDAPEGAAAAYDGITLLPYNASLATQGGFVLTAAEYVNTLRTAREAGASGCLLLGPEAQSLEPVALQRLVAPVAAGEADLVVARYAAGAREGLVNSAILYPLTSALFGARPRFPLALDVAISLRMADRLGAAGQRLTAANQPEGLVWPVAEAAVANLRITEADAGHRTFPQPSTGDLNALLAHITGSLFGDLETKAAFWQRSRPAAISSPILPEPFAATEPFDTAPMVDAFRVAYRNLGEIWSLVLPPQSLLGLKKLSVMPAEAFRMPDALWARTVYDFVLAYRLRTLNRGHLLGALTPLYLAWVGSHLQMVNSGIEPERHIAETVAAFEADKPYLVSRWRWPDRFNP